MENFYMKPTFQTPEIYLNNLSGQISIRGQLCPHDSTFWDPLLAHLHEYLCKPAEQTVLSIYPTYINSFSARIIAHVINLLESKNSNKSLKLKWYFEDDEEKEEWMVYDDITSLTIDFIRYENLYIEAAKLTPKVSFKYIEGDLRIDGRVYPENNDEFVKPIIDWLKKYFEDPFETTMLRVHCDAISADTKFFTLIFTELKNAYVLGNKIEVEWHYDDEDILEYGKNYEVLSNLPFSFIDESSSLNKDYNRAKTKGHH
jgi:hypothetical protein